MIEILHPGVQATVQDCGRYGYRRYGVPISGAMDNYALRVANLLAGNSEKEAGIEIPVGYGFKLVAHREILMAITGGGLSPKINHTPVPMWCPVRMKQDDQLTFGPPHCGFRAYMAIRGGIETPLRMNSYSPMMASPLGILKTGDSLRIGSREICPERDLRPLPEDYKPEYQDQILLRVLLGPQEDYFQTESLKVFLDSSYTITPQSNRQGYRLHGPALKHVRTHDIISEAVWPGAIQVPGDGLPILLCVDAQTTGGYPKIASVISADLSKLGQAQPSNKVSFESVSIEEAHDRYQTYEKQIVEIRKAVWGRSHDGAGI